MTASERRDYHDFCFLWNSVLKHALNHQEGFLEGILQYTSITETKFKEFTHFSEIIIEETRAYLVFANNEIILFRWAIDNEFGRF